VKTPDIFEEEKNIWEKLGIAEKQEAENGEEENGDNGAEEETDIVEVLNNEISLLSREELSKVKSALGKEEDIDEEVISSRIEKLYNLKNYPFNALEIIPDLGEGTVLKQADFILTLLSVFWVQGRAKIDDFCKAAKLIPEKNVSESPYNYIFEPTPKDLVRITVGLGFGRGKMKDAYSILTGRDFVTKSVSEKLRDEQFENF
jgi:hypothetical protein